MRDPVEMVLGLSHDLAGVDGGGARTIAVAEALQALVPAEMVGYAEVAIGGRTADMLTPTKERTRVAAAVPSAIAKHPIAVALRARPGTATALRISDVVAPLEWRRHEVYHALFRPLGFAHELVLPLPSTQPGRMVAWSWNRTPGRDFADETVVLATLLRPLLAAIQLPALLSRAVGDPDDVVVRAGLTAREAEILGMLPTGMTAQQMAWVLRISARTVNKHVEHLYEKLGVHDRTSAVLIALRTAGTTQGRDAAP